MAQPGGHGGYPYPPMHPIPVQPGGGYPPPEYPGYPNQPGYMVQPGYPNQPQPPGYPPPYGGEQPHIYTVPHAPQPVPVAASLGASKGQHSSLCRVLVIVVVVLTLAAIGIAAWRILNGIASPTSTSSGGASGSTSVMEDPLSIYPVAQQCNGRADAADGGDEVGCVQVSGASSLLQVYSGADAAWRTVCADSWRNELDVVACRQLGFDVSGSSHLMIPLSSVDPALRQSFTAVGNATNANMGIQAMVQSRPSCPSGNGISLTCIACGTNTVTRIVGGTNSALGRWPWQLSLQYHGSHACGGSIVAPGWVVTAAHCVSQAGYNQASSWMVYGGFLNLNQVQTAQSSTVKQIYVNQDYDPATQDYDIALMKLTRPMTLNSGSLKPVCLPTAGMDFPSGQSCWISGWGVTRENGNVANTMQEAQVPLIDLATCNGASMYSGQLTQRMQCAGFQAGKVDACQGDSGGPLVCTSNDGLWRLTGATSWGAGCARANRPGIYSKIPAYLRWITWTMAYDLKNA